MPLGLIFCHLMQTVKHFNRSLTTLPCHTRKTTIQKYGVSNYSLQFFFKEINNYTHQVCNSK